MTSVAVLGLGRMGTAMADRLASSHDVRTWNRSGGATASSAAEAVTGADVVLLSLYDGAACRDVLAACLRSVPATAVVVNTTTVGIHEASELEAEVLAHGAAYLHAPVLGSTPAVAAGRLSILAGATPSGAAAEVLGLLGEAADLGGSARAAAYKLVANGVLGDSVLSLRRALARGDALGLPRDVVLDVVGRTALGRLVEGKRDLLGDPPVNPLPPTTFATGALAKDLALLADALDTVPGAAAALEVLLATKTLEADHDIALASSARTDLAWLADARLDVSPEVVADPDVLRPLHAYALTHATGDPGHLDHAFLPTAHIEGYRDGQFTSWTVEAFRDVFAGSPADDEPTRTRRIERLDANGSVATATMTLRHGEVDFTDVFVLLRDPASGQWRIANKVYERRTTNA